MTMLHRITRPTAALLFAAALVVGLASLLPGDVGAAVRCFCPPSTSELVHGWGKDAGSCAVARNKCAVDAQNKASNYCASAYGTGVCATGTLQYFPANGCAFMNGMHVSDCDLSFACDQCIDTSFP